MGQAKRRGSYEERKKEGEVKRRLSEDHRAAIREANRRSPKSRKAIMSLAMVQAMCSIDLEIG